MLFSASQHQQESLNLLMQPPALPTGRMSTERPIVSSVLDAAAVAPAHQQTQVRWSSSLEGLEGCRGTGHSGLSPLRLFSGLLLRCCRSTAAHLPTPMSSGHCLRSLPRPMQPAYAACARTCLDQPAAPRCPEEAPHAQPA